MTNRGRPTVTPIGDVTSIRELQEQRWAYERRLERMQFVDMADRAALPVERGGLGYPVGAKVLAKRVRAYVAFNAEAEAETRDEHRARELAGMDRRQRAHMEHVDRVDAQASMVNALRSTGLLMSLEDIMRDHPECVELRDERVILAAWAAIEKIAVERRKMLGLDAPAEAHVVVTTAADQQLADLAAQLDLTPTTVTPEGATP